MDAKAPTHEVNLSQEAPRSGWTKRLLSRRTGEAATEIAASSRPLGPPPPEPVVVAAGCTMDGTLASERPIHVEGSFRGTIESQDRVVVDVDATVEGDIVARSVLIRGAVVGDVSGRREVVLEATGRLHGAVATACLEIARGAYFNGPTRMHRPQDRRPLELPAPVE